MRTFLAWLGRHWCRGLRKASTPGPFFWLCFWLFVFLPLYGYYISELLFWLVLACFLAAMPIMASWCTPAATDPEDMLRRQSEWFEASVLQLSEKVGVDWNEHLISRIDKLLADGHQSAAVKLYRQEAGVTWDEAYLALDNWSKICPFGPSVPTRLQLRVITLAAQLDTSRQMPKEAPVSLCESAVG